METNFLYSGNSFSIRATFLLVETIIRIRGRQFGKTEFILPGELLIFWLVKVISPIFSETPGSDKLFSRPVRTIFEQNPSFGLMEMDFRPNNGFHKHKKKL